MPDSQPSLEVIAPTIEEAISRGASELGVQADDLEVEILDEGSKGVLGVGSRQARVRLTLPDRKTADRAAGPAPAEVRAPNGEPQPGAAPTEDLSHDEIPGDEDEQAITLRLAKEAVEDLLGLMDVEANIEAHWGEPDSPDKMSPLFVDVTGEDLSLLIGRRGDTLEDLQYIVRLIMGKELKKPVPVIIDVEGYRQRREQTLRRLARRMAEQAIERGRTLSLEPMPPNERRIIHVELRNDPQVKTKSIGEGDGRKVTIIPQR